MTERKIRAISHRRLKKLLLIDILKGKGEGYSVGKYTEQYTENYIEDYWDNYIDSH